MVPVSRYWLKLRRGCFRFPDFCSTPYKKKFQKFHNSRTSDDIGMKLGPVPKLDKRNRTTQKKLTMMSCRNIVTSLPFFRFFANLEQSGGQIPDTESAKAMFLVMVIFCLTETENRTKKSPTQLSHYCFE